MTHRFGEVGPALKQAGWDIIPIKGRTKGPQEAGWQHGFTSERIAAFAANGYASGNTGLNAKNYPGLDIDVSDKTAVRAIIELARSVLGPAPVRVGSAPKALLMYGTAEPFKKVKVYLTAPDGSTKGPDGKDLAVEFLGDGQQYVIYGEHPDGFEYRWPQGGGPLDSEVWDLTYITLADVQRFVDALPAALPQGWSIRSQSAVAASGPGADAFATYRAPLEGWGIERVREEVMAHLDLEMDYDSWVRVGQALHHQFDGADEAFELWDETFQGSSKYTNPEYGHARWRSFKAQRPGGNGPVTLAALLAMTKEARAAQAAAAVIDSATTHRAAIEAAADEAAVRDAAQRIALDAGLDRLARDTLAGIIQQRLQTINGVKPRIEVVRALVTLAHGGAAHSEAPDWLQPWVYVTGSAKFFNRTSKEVLTREAFDAAHNRLMPTDADGNRPSAARVACEEWAIPTVYETMYLPSAGDLFTIDGREYANLYRPDTVPGSVVDPAASAVLQQHIDLLVPNPTYRKTLLQWMAWVARNPGLKVLWAILIKGVEGDGKSILGSMLGQAMGYANVGIISPDTLSNSSFNDWAAGRCVNVIEELKLQGHNRHDVVNKIKPLVTNERIELHGKGKAATTVVNTTNYMAFSNHSDAIPLDEHDRRLFVLFTPWRDIAGMHAAIAELGLAVDQYWDRLWDVVKNRPDAVRGFLDSVDLSDFDPKSRAPATTFKAAVVAAADMDDAEAIAKFHIEEGAHGVSKTILSSACLTKLLAERDQPITLHTTRVRRLLESLGFEQVPGLLKWKGWPHRVWVRVTGLEVTGLGVGATPADLRAALDLTAVSGVEDFLQ